MKFRKVTAIIRPERLEAVEHRLRQLGVPGVSVSKVKGFGEYSNFFESDWMCSHLRVEVFVGEFRADETVEGIMEAAWTGLEGDGMVAVSPVESVFHVRSKKRCGDDTCS